MATLPTIDTLKTYFNTGDFPTEAQFAEFINKAAVYGGDAIFTTNNKIYPLVGLTDTQRGDQLKLAISEFVSDNFIMIPPGGYYSADGFHWKGRDGGIIGMGISSKATYLYSDADHCLKMDTSYTLYNSGHRNFAVGTTTTGLDIDAIHFGGIDGVGVTQSNVELDLHIAQSDRDGLHIQDVISGRFRFKTTGQTVSTAVDRYMVYANDCSGFNIQLDDNQETVIYLDTNTNNVAVTMTTTVEAGGISATPYARLIDLGTDNAFFSPSDVYAYKRQNVFANARVQSPILEIPQSKVVAYYPFDRFVGDITPDLTSNQIDVTKSGGVTLVDTPLGKVASLDGVDGIMTIPISAPLQTITTKVTMGFIVKIDATAITSRVIYNGVDVKYDATLNRLEVGVVINGAYRLRFIPNIVTDTYYAVVYGYDGAEYFLRSNTYETGRAALASGTIAMGVNPMVVGKIGTTYFKGEVGDLIFLNDCTDELVKAVEAKLILNASNKLNASVNRFGNNSTYGDFTFETDTNGVILVDRTTSTKYRLKVDSGVLGVEAV